MEHDFQFSAGHRLYDYRIEAPLHRGAMAEVYKAVDRLTREAVALKVPSRDIINHPLIYYHYQNEMRILAGLDHPGVVRALGHDRTSAYAIFEFVPGDDLRRHLNAPKRLSLVRALDYTDQVAAGLGYLHGCGIIHLDIKPENLLITSRERVKIIDFGLARHVGAPDLLFEDFVRAHGTPDYVSPEQLVRVRNDFRSDQYSLALVLYEMLTGRLPFDKGRRLSQVRRRLKAAPIAPRRLRPEIPAAVETVVLKALEVDPLMRYPTMDAFREALQAAGRPAQHRTPGTSGANAVPPAVSLCPIPPFAEGRPGILAAIADDDHADAVAESALQAAMADSLPVTILTVVSSDVDDEWVRYGDISRGKQLSRRLAHLSFKFRRFGIDPSVRIRSGNPADVIVETARAINARQIFTGPVRRGLVKRLFGGGTIRQVMKTAQCPVAVTGKVRPLLFPVGRRPAELSRAEIHGAERFLTACWIEQIDWLADRVQGLLADADVARELPRDRPLLHGRFQRVRFNEDWAQLLGPVGTAFDQLRDALMKIETAFDRLGGEGAGPVFLAEALPAVCRLREELGRIRGQLRSLHGLPAPPATGLLSRHGCPLHEHQPMGSGPIQQIRILREYFCRRDDAPRQPCLDVTEEAQKMTA